MVLVLSAVVVAGVMVYYQTAQSNNNLDRLGSQVMHIMSEINGLYANGKQYSGGTDYAGLSTDSVAAAVSDVEIGKIDDGSGKNTFLQVIKTAFPYTGLQFDTVTAGAPLVPGGAPTYALASGSANRFIIKIVGTDVIACTKLMGMNFGPQLEAVQISTQAGTRITAGDILKASEPFSKKVAKCQAASAPGAGGKGQRRYISLIMK